MSAERPNARPADWLYGAFVVCCLAAVTWPGYAWLGNRLEPYVLGIPFSLAWVAGWVLLSFVALALYHATRPAPPHGD